MRFTQLGALAVTASVSQAFLVPPEISSADTDIIKTLPFEDSIAIDGRVIEINCPGCSVVADIESTPHIVQDSILQLNFSIAHDGPDKLLLNGQPLYPMDLLSTTFLEPLTASQMIKKPDGTWEQTSTPTLGYSVSVRHPVTFSNNNPIDLVEIHLEIMEVANKFLNGIPSIEIKLLETPSGKLMIGDATITAPKSLSINPTDDEQECTTLLCKWQAIFADRLSKLKAACGSKTSSSYSQEPKPHVYPDRPGHKRPHSRPHGAQRPWRHHHRHSGLSRFLRSVVLHVFIPVLIGITVGITASLVGMVVGHIVIFLWRVLFRRNQAKYTLVQQEEIVADNEQVKSFTEPQGPPPQYEEAVVTEKGAE